jgi:hypothetical protein
LKCGEDVGRFFDLTNILGEARGGRRRNNNHLNLAFALNAAPQTSEFFSEADLFRRAAKYPPNRGLSAGCRAAD